MAGRFARRASPDGEVNALPNTAPSSLTRAPPAPRSAPVCAQAWRPHDLGGDLVRRPAV